MSQYFDVDDPLAAKTAWTPLSPGGFNFTTHRLVEAGPSRLAMKLTVGVRLFAIILSLTGAAAYIVSAAWPGQLLGILLFTTGPWILARRSPVFDAAARQFEGAERIPFSSIHALQVIKDDDEDSERYELNLVLTSGERINAAKHSDRAQVKQEAQRLGAFVGCKVWDTTAA